MTAWLSSAFLAPALLGFLALIPVVVLLYLLKLRRTRVVVSSTLLWQKSLHDFTANAPFQRLRKNLLLLLQILVLTALAVALARPFVQAEGRAGDTVCLLLDRSASMSVVEDGATRFEQARRRALELVDEMERGDRMMIIAFAENADVLTELTGDRGRLRQVLASVEPSDTATRLKDALTVAHGLQLSAEDLDVVILSDGKVGDLADLGTRDYKASYVQVGQTSENAGITAFSLRRPQPGETQHQTFALVRNAGAAPLETTLTLSFNGQILAVDEVAAAPGEDAEVVFAHEDLGEGVLQAELDVEDALAVDNSAWLALRPPVKVRVLIVAAPDDASAYFLQRALGTQRQAEVSTITPENYAPTGDYDLVCAVNAELPALPESAVAFFNSPPPVEGVEPVDTVANAPVIAVDNEHFLMRFLNPSNVGIAKAVRYDLPEDARVLVSTTGAPLIADISRGGRRMVLTTFDIADSDWPLRLSFPLFVQNLLAWAPRAAAEADMSTPAGRPISIPPTEGAAEAVVRAPDGRSDRLALDPARPVYYGATEIAGVYEVQIGDNVRHYAVNLLDRTETAVAPEDAIELGGGQAEAQKGNVRQTRELWRWFAAAALIILAAEWFLYARRAWL